MRLNKKGLFVFGITIFIILLISGGVFIYIRKKSKIEFSDFLIQNRNEMGIAQTTTKGTEKSISNPNQLNPDVVTYTSVELGVQFSYLQNSPPIQIIEKGDKISFNNIESRDYIRVFERLPGETIEQTLKRLIPDQFNSNYCSVIQDSRRPDLGYFIWDSRLNINQRGTDAGPGYGSNLSNICNPSMWLYFKTDPNFPNRIYYLNYSTQEPSYWADKEETKQWTQTVHLISKL